MKKSIIDKLATEIVASYDDLTSKQKNLIDIGDVDDFSGSEMRDLTNSCLNNLSKLTIKTTLGSFLPEIMHFYYIKNIKDRKLIDFVLNYGENYENKKWFFEYMIRSGGSGEGSVFTKTFKEAIEMMEEEFSIGADKIQVSDSILENKAIQASNSKMEFNSFEQFLEYLKK